MKRIKSGDKVIVTAGKSKGHVGIVKTVNDQKVLVEGANIIKKHIKPNPQIEQPGGIVSVEAPVHVSNVSHYNPVTKRADKVGFRSIDKDGKTVKVRYFKSNDEMVDIA